MFLYSSSSGKVPISLTLKTLSLLKSMEQLIFRMSLKLDLSDVSSQLGSIYTYLEEISQM